MLTYICQNDGCKDRFNNFKSDQPICPTCGGDDCIWCPPNYKGSSKAVDQTLKSLASDYKLSNMGQRGGTRNNEIAKRINNPQGSGTMYRPVGGVEVPFSDVPTATFSSTGFKAPVSTPIGGAFKGQRSVPGGMQKVVARHKGG